MQTPVYEASCSIRVIERKSISDMITEMVSWTSYDLMSSLPKVLTGRSVMEKVAYRLGLIDEDMTLDESNRIVLGLQGAVKAETLEGTNIIAIIVQHESPEMAAKIADAVADVYIKVDIEEKGERARNVRIFIEEQLADAEKRLGKAEEDLKAFKEKEGATGIAVELQNNIIVLERQKVDLRKIYTEKYPDVVEVNKRIEELKERLKTMPASELEFARLTREFSVSDGSYRLLLSKLDEARIAEAEKVEDVKIVNPAVIPTTPVKPKMQMAVVMGLVIGLAMGIFLSFVIETLDTSIGTIDDLESLLKLPVLTVIPYMKPIATKVTSRLDRLLNFFQTSKKGKKTRIDSVEELKQFLLIKHSQKSSTTEAFRILRTNIKIEELLKNDQRVLLITSTIPREGKSIVALNLAMSLAQDGYRTLLVDSDLRKALLHKVFSIDKEPGLSDILLGSTTPQAAVRNLVDMMMADAGVEEAFKMPGFDNFHLLTCGKIVSNPAELLDSTDVRELFSNLKAQYNFLVVDCPPVLPVPDAIILGRKIADKIYLVYRGGYTSKLAIARAKEQLDIMKLSPAGIILNSTTPESQIVSDYYHHYYRYRYYAEPEKEKGEEGAR